MIRFLLIVFTCMLVSCYSFKGITIAPNIKTFYVENFNIVALSTPASIEVQTAEALRQKIRTNSRLIASSTDPDVEFSGSISRYDVDATATTSNDESALNKLTLAVKIDYVDNKNEDKSYSKTYSQSVPYSADQDLQAVESQLVRTLIDEITEQIFNDTYTDW